MICTFRMQINSVRLRDWGRVQIEGPNESAWLCTSVNTFYVKMMVQTDGLLLDDKYIMLKNIKEMASPQFHIRRWFSPTTNTREFSKTHFVWVTKRKDIFRQNCVRLFAFFTLTCTVYGGSTRTLHTDADFGCSSEKKIDLIIVIIFIRTTQMWYKMLWLISAAADDDDDDVISKYAIWLFFGQ